jgi:hypothetical protein
MNGQKYFNFQKSSKFLAPLEEGSARRRGLKLTTNNNHKRQTSMPLTGFEVAIPARPQTPALDRVTTGIGVFTYLFLLFLALKLD